MIVFVRVSVVVCMLCVCPCAHSYVVSNVHVWVRPCVAYSWFGIVGGCLCVCVFVVVRLLWLCVCVRIALFSCECL